MKKLKLKLSEIYELMNISLIPLSRFNLKLNQSIKVSKNILALKTEHEEIDKKRLELIKKYSIKNSNGAIPENKKEALQKDWENIVNKELSEEVEIKLYKIELYSNIDIAANILMPLEEKGLLEIKDEKK